MCCGRTISLRVLLVIGGEDVEDVKMERALKEHLSRAGDLLEEE